MLRSAIRATSWRGASRDELVNIQLSNPPVTTVLDRRSKARNAGQHGVIGLVNRCE